MGSKSPNSLFALASHKVSPKLFARTGLPVPGESDPIPSAGNEGLGKPPSANTKTTLTTQEKTAEPSRRRAGPTTSTNKRPGSAKKTLLGV
jgi:hypothetical protein